MGKVFDKNGSVLNSGDYVYFKPDKENNPYHIPDHAPEEILGWIFIGRDRAELWTNNTDNHLRYTGFYFDLDDEPLWEVERQ